MYFSSKNWAGAHPAISQSLSTHATGFASAYGKSEPDKEVERRFSQIFERDVSVFYVSTGTAANALSLTLMANPGGVVFAYRGAHIAITECGAVEHLSAQLRLSIIAGARGKIDAGKLQQSVEDLADGDVHLVGQLPSLSVRVPSLVRCTRWQNWTPSQRWPRLSISASTWTTHGSPTASSRWHAVLLR